MTSNRRHLCTRYLALVSALLWPTLFSGAGKTPGAPRGTAGLAVSACHPTVIVPAMPNERKPVAKCERTGLNGNAAPIPAQAPAARTESERVSPAA